MEPASVILVAGLLYGDEGKGTTIDFLARQFQASLVVRYNGGPQAMHHVVLPSGIWHCFSQFGSATFVHGVRTLLSKHMVISPPNLMREEQELRESGVTDAITRLHIDRQCRIVTPLHRLVTQIAEILRGAGRHGSTGIGVGVTVEDALANDQWAFGCADTAATATHLDSPPTCILVEDLLDLDGFATNWPSVCCSNVANVRKMDYHTFVFQDIGALRWKDRANVWRKLPSSSKVASCPSPQTT
eukprot:NODE_1020_length_1936_cov_144.322670_g969_i0.p1 GENE.NODE_1020_length_1936_cov_144.322670_g969_i0~~NODE_1020_length_1936_cov_144.322670_g969_i0.p1  ORF type:complete len:244 (+),score=25.14 NODE_1020_length_1936_cov_144.322670_g969_i0:61-792(+)